MLYFLHRQLAVDSCPHCGRSNPTLEKESDFLITKTYKGDNERWWGIYICKSCGGVVTACAPKKDSTNQPLALPIANIYPNIPIVSDAIPEKPREFLRQAQNSLHAPAGAIMLSASAIDAMLKEKKYIGGTLYERIDKAAKDHLITDEMARWAHQTRLDANDQRHAGKDVELPNEKKAKLAFDFAVSFAEYLFVLPSKVKNGITDSKSEN